MCNPALAVTAISTLYAANESSKARQDVTNARNEKAQFEADRQTSYSNDIEARVDEQLGGLQGGASELRQNLLNERLAVINSNYDSDISKYIPALNNPKEVNSEYGRQLNKSLKKGREQAISKAKLGNYGDLNAANALTRLAGQSDISRYLNFAKGSQNAFGIELNAAGRAGDRRKFNAEIARGVGSIAAAQAGKNSRYKTVEGDANYPSYDYYRGRR